MVDNVIPLYRGGKKKNPEQEPLKIWGRVDGDRIVPAVSPAFTAQCLRVPVSDGHFAAVYCRFENKPSKEEIIQAWREFSGEPQKLELPSAPVSSSTISREDNMPQTRLHRGLEGGMAVSWAVCGGYAIRLQIRRPVAQHPARRGGRRRTAGRASVRQGIYGLTDFTDLHVLLL